MPSPLYGTGQENMAVRHIRGYPHTVLPARYGYCIPSAHRMEWDNKRGAHIVQSDTLAKVGHRICTNACKGGSSRRQPTAAYMVQPRRHRWVRPSVVKM